MLATRGIHDAVVMPFAVPWTDAPAGELVPNTLRYFWRNRADTTVEQWDLNFAVVVDGAATGMCSVEAHAFPAHRTAQTGSWLGSRFQGRGWGTEMRHAALHLIFAGFEADHATTSAWHDNHASLGVTRSLPYVEVGTSGRPRRDRTATMINFAMSRAGWETARRSDIRLRGIEAVRAQLKTARAPASTG